MKAQYQHRAHTEAWLLVVNKDVTVVVLKWSILNAEPRLLLYGAKGTVVAAVFSNRIYHQVFV